MTTLEQDVIHFIVSSRFDRISVSISHIERKFVHKNFGNGWKLYLDEMVSSGLMTLDPYEGYMVTTKGLRGVS